MERRFFVGLLRFCKYILFVILLFAGTLFFAPKETFSQSNYSEVNLACEIKSGLLFVMGENFGLTSECESGNGRVLELATAGPQGEKGPEGLPGIRGAGSVAFISSEAGRAFVLDTHGKEYKIVAGEFVDLVRDLPVAVTDVVQWQGSSFINTGGEFWWWEPTSSWQTYEQNIAEPGGYQHIRAITVNSSMVSGNSDLVDFPVLISDTYSGEGGEPDMRDTDNGGDIENTATGGASGETMVPADLAFFTDQALTNQIDHEIQEYDSSTGKIIAWVEIPTLKHNEDTLIYMAYGNAVVAESQEDVYGTWDSYDGVWHLSETGTGVADEFKDSTNNVNHGWGGGGTAVAVPIQTSGGKVGGANDFDGGDWIDIGDVGTFDNQSEITLEAWVKFDTLPNDLEFIIRKGTNDKQRITLNKLHSANINTDKDVFEVEIMDANKVKAVVIEDDSVVDDLQTGVWYQAVGRWRGSDNTTDIFRNGNRQDEVDLSTGSPDDTGGDNQHLLIGAEYNSGSVRREFYGIIDEVRISNRFLSDGWIKTNFNTTDSPATFYTISGDL